MNGVCKGGAGSGKDWEAILVGGNWGVEKARCREKQRIEDEAVVIAI